MAYNLASMTVQVRSFAKINLGLRIGAGAGRMVFHELLTVYQTIGLHDLIGVSVSRGAGIEIRCDDPRVRGINRILAIGCREEAMRAMKGKGRVVIEIEESGCRCRAGWAGLPRTQWRPCWRWSG